MSTVYAYAIHPHTGTVHLYNQTARWTSEWPVHTLCGILLKGWALGDETLNGVAVTCRSCEISR